MLVKNRDGTTVIERAESVSCERIGGRYACKVKGGDDVIDVGVGSFLFESEDIQRASAGGNEISVDFEGKENLLLDRKLDFMKMTR